MEIEKQRGISVTSSVLQFEYRDFCINILDTPGHQDFSEDTYRTLMAADSAVMVIDGSKGCRGTDQKNCLRFAVCVIFRYLLSSIRWTVKPRIHYELMEEIEAELGIKTCAINWPIGSGKRFKGVYERETQKVLRFQGVNGTREAEVIEADLNDTSLADVLEEELYLKLKDDVELLDGASEPFDLEAVRRGELSPVCFGSALTNFGVEPFLNHFLDMTTSPLPRYSGDDLVDPFSEDFSGFVFKIQANMNKAHRDADGFCTYLFR